MNDEGDGGEGREESSGFVVFALSRLKFNIDGRSGGVGGIRGTMGKGQGGKMREKCQELAEKIAKHLIQNLHSAMGEAKADSPAGMLACGKIFECAGLLAAATDCYEIASQGDSTSALARLAICHLKAGNWEAGLEAAVKLAGIDRSHRIAALATGEQITSMAILGDALVLSRRQDEAVSAYRAALQDDPKQSYAAGRLAHLLLVEGKVEEAVKLQKAIGNNIRFDEVQAILRLAATDPKAVPPVGFDRVRAIVEVSVHGRPLLVEDEARLASPALGKEWRSAREWDLAGAPQERAEAGRAWEEAGRGEHASIASFAKFALELVALGAPPDLLHDTGRAMQDEIEHARLSLGVASNLLERDVSVGPLDVSGVLADFSVSKALRGAIVEGCINETLAAHEASLAAESAEDADLRASLERLAEDEGRHADLAWRFVAWLLHQRPHLAREAASLFASATHSFREVGTEGRTSCLGEGRSRLGRPGIVQRKALAAHVLDQVIRPRAAKLLAEARGASRGHGSLSAIGPDPL